jgi:hypothetical protein
VSRGSYDVQQKIPLVVIFQLTCQKDEIKEVSWPIVEVSSHLGTSHTDDLWGGRILQKIVFEEVGPSFLQIKSQHLPLDVAWSA